MSEHQSPRKEKSEFAQALEAVLDATGVPRQQWASWLEVSGGALSQWTSDTVIPSADNLHRLVSVLRNFEDIDGEALERFSKALHAPSKKVARKPRKVAPSFGHYMLQSLRENFFVALKSLPLKVQEELLLSGIAMCREWEHTPGEARKEEAASFFDEPKLCSLIGLWEERTLKDPLEADLESVEAGLESPEESAHSEETVDAIGLSEQKDALGVLFVDGELESHSHDRSRFHLWCAGLHGADELLSRKLSRDNDRVFAQLLSRFPLRALDNETDEEFYEATLAQWRGADPRKQLMHTLYQFQEPDQRTKLAKELCDIGSKWEAGSAELLLWAPCAVNVARRISLIPRQRRQAGRLLALVRDRLSSDGRMLALHWYGMAAKLDGDLFACKRAWQQMTQMPLANPMGLSPQRRRIWEVLGPCQEQLSFSARLNLAILSVEEALDGLREEMLQMAPQELAPLFEMVSEAEVEEASDWVWEHRVSLREALLPLLRDSKEVQESTKAFRAILEESRLQASHTPDFDRMLQKDLYVANCILGEESEIPPLESEVAVADVDLGRRAKNNPPVAFEGPKSIPNKLKDQYNEPPRALADITISSGMRNAV